MKLYHYTDAHALMGIISQEELWLTDIFYMNDSHECSSALKKYQRGVRNKGMGMFLELLNRSCPAPHAERKPSRLGKFKVPEWEKPPSPKSLCVISFCQERDLLSQWRGYSRTHIGYCLEFNSKELQKYIGALDCQNALLNCIYNPKETTNHIKALVDLTQHNRWYNFFEEIYFKIGQVKNPAFSEEKEVRAMIATDVLKHREKNGVISPYASIPLNRELIKSITIGPHYNNTLAKNGLESFLESHYEKDKKPKVFVSRTPLRT